MIVIHNLSFQINLLGIPVCHLRTDNSGDIWAFYFVLGLFKGFNARSIYKITN